MHVSEFEMWELTGRQRVKVHLSRATEKALHRLGCIVGKTLGLYAAPCLQAQSKLCTQCREMTFALECTHIPQGQQPAASTPLGGWVQNGRGLTLKKKKKLFIRFYETNEAGPCGVGGGQCIPLDGWSLITLHYHWAGFLLLGPFYPGDTPQCFHGLQVTKVWSEQWKACTSLSLRVWCLREDILAHGKGLTYQGLSLCPGRMWPREEIGRWKVNSVYDISSEDLDPPQGTNIHISTWIGKTTANPSINYLTCTYHVTSIAPC